MTETATANNPTDATASTDASATLLATAGNGTGTAQQTQTTQARQPPAAEKPATTTTETPVTPAAPESYTFTAPEGTTYDSEILGAFSGAAKKANLTQDVAQKLVEEMAPAIAARQADQVKAIHKEWQDASNSDTEFGGVKLAENLGVARKALDNFGTPELRTLLDETGLGNHPEVIRFMFRAGKAISEDKFVGGKPAGAGTVNPANILYDKTAK